MKKIALRFLILSCLLKVALCVVFGENVYVTDRKKWSEAREYCREHHTDLTSIGNLEDEIALHTGWEPFWSDKAWIGLHKDANDSWKWSGGNKASFFYWSNPEEANKEERCVAHKDDGWHTENCEHKLKFHCYNSSLVLVKENKTWEEALQYCRQRYTDLVDLASESALTETLQMSKEAQTDHVWTALRYLGDSWLWVNGQSMVHQAWRQGEAPQCQAWSHHCGVLSVKGRHWDSWDCADKLNFVCY